MTDIILVLDESEQHAVEAAFAVYRGHLIASDALGGDAAEAAQIMGPIFGRVDRQLAAQMYGAGEPIEPDWLHEQDDPITAAKAEADRLGHYPAGVSYHDWQRAL